MKILSVEVLTMIATILGSNGIIYLIDKTMLTRWESKHPVVMRDDRVDELRANTGTTARSRLANGTTG